MKVYVLLVGNNTGIVRVFRDKDDAELNRIVLEKSKILVAYKEVEVE